MIKNPTEEQKRIFHFIENRSENLLINAFAGTGKSSTIIESIKYIPKDKSITFLAFNKHIQEELKTKLPEWVRCYTTYGLGLSALKRKYKDKIQFDEFKADKIILKKSKTWDLESELKTDDKIAYYLSSIKKLVNLCRLTVTVKADNIPFIADRYEITNLSKPIDIKRVLKVLDIMTLDRTTYDFIDQVYLPAIDNSIWMFPQDYVYVDEGQDVGVAQQRIIEKILKKDKVTGKIIGRLIVIGDKFQSIYSFNGIIDTSFKWVEKYPNLKVLPLSVSFRCPKNIILKANEIVPDIKALDNAPDGIVRDGDVLTEVESGDFVLCRTTMPLVKLFFQFLIQHKKAIIKGSDIGLSLIELIGKNKDIQQLISFWENELINFINDLKNKGILNPHEHSGYIALEDKVSTLIFLAKLSHDINDLKEKIKMIFTDNIQGIVLSTIHKIKGLESDRVFIIRPDLLPLPQAHGWQYQQEKNLEYVAITRSRLELIYDRNWTDELKD